MLLDRLVSTTRGRNVARAMSRAGLLRARLDDVLSREISEKAPRRDDAHVGASMIFEALARVLLIAETEFDDLAGEIVTTARDARAICAEFGVKLPRI